MSMTFSTPLLETLRGAGRIAILTGAGVSAESGVPTFRDALIGLWERFKPEELATQPGGYGHDVLPRTSRTAAVTGERDGVQCGSKWVRGGRGSPFKAGHDPGRRRITGPPSP